MQETGVVVLVRDVRDSRGVALSWRGGVVSVLPPTWPGVVVCSLLHGLAYRSHGMQSMACGASGMYPSVHMLYTCSPAFRYVWYLCR